MVSAAMALATSVRSDLAIDTAPSTLSMPAPCCSRLAVGSGCALYCKMALISGGVRPGLACSISATVPATAGAATEVPLSSICVSARLAVTAKGSTSAVLYMVPRKFQVSALPAVAAAPTILLPGATRSGLSRLSARRTPVLSSVPPRVGPRELKEVTTSSPRAVVSLKLAAPTVMTEGSLPGDPMAP